MLPLDTRKIQILRAIVHDYVLTTKPVGSERLIEVYQLACKPATVRNEMAEMSGMGYLLQPHTSSGRIPTDQGYRYYVDELMNPPGALSEEETNQAKTHYSKEQTEVEEILQQTCQILSEMTSYTSVATDPSSASTTIQRIYLQGASSRHVLLVVLLSTGQVEHRLLDVENAPDDAILNMLSNFINSLVVKSDLEQLDKITQSHPIIPTDMQTYSTLVKRVLTSLQQLSITLSERRVYLGGAKKLLRQPEFHDIQRLEMLLSMLEKRSALYQVLSRTLMDCDVTIYIGAENTNEEMQDCSIITTSYRIGTRPAGFIGVVGPTRMNYDRAVAAVGLMSNSLSQMLTNLSLA